jgi:hypothetical protein
MAQRLLRIFVNNILYKEVTVETDSLGRYNPIPIFSMIMADKLAGYFVDYNIPPGTFPIRIEFHR